ncbi:unnamed protein product [Rotaria socialis]|uniref:Aminotransferase class I/classII large domain-containing protein n=2 Tax=Rotaria socialis TaxID=392032 RepID=A0A818MDE1_9BILA|nr:unnamed protein product [Rotaria socialis]CAF3587597.1 unnamed protein product [Rotaria socialis]CAF4209467.1 unnamed protein product [Rotaria socialis]CAF4489817.1 unnamed protein product [Rotaria socialis]
MTSSHDNTLKQKSSDTKSENLLAKRFLGLEKNIWIEFSALAIAHKAVNVGQGFIDYAPPHYFIDLYKETLDDPNILLHQYTRGYGHRRLVDAISNVYSPYFNRKIDPLNEVLITGGAYPSLFNCIHAFVNPGDEVILIEPFFDCYEPMVRSAGGIPRCIALKPKPESTQADCSSSSDWILDKKELESLFNPRTRLILTNTPNNPVGKVFTQEELEHIACLCQKHDVICISDEVYEWIVYDENKKHIRMSTLPNMWERTLTIGSAGKTFSSTGLKLGWTIGPSNLVRGCQIVHQDCVYTCPTISQEVVARCFEYELKRLNSPECYFNYISKELLEKRDKLVQVLKECGMKPVIPDGGYFILADFSEFGDQFQSDADDMKDFKFVRHLTKEKQLATIPVTGFYTADDRHLAENYIRFCFAKKDETLDKAIEILRKLKAN